jgi:hypothetical protein
MILRVMIAAAAALVTAGGLAQPAPKTGVTCEGETFEFRATTGERLTKVTLCSKKDATPTDLVKMFKSAVATLEKDRRLDPGRRAELVTQIKAKIAEIEGQAVAAVGAAPTAPPIAKPAPSASNDAKPEYSLLPPLPAPKPAPVAPSASTSPKVEYSVLPPLPAPTNVAAATAATTSLPLLSKPRIDIDCFNPADMAGAGPCSELSRDTRVTVRAGETVPAGTSLRFVRRGDFRAEVELAQLAAGKSIQFLLPRQVCAGVVESKVEIQVVRKAKPQDSAGQVVDSMGPYLLRC